MSALLTKKDNPSVPIVLLLSPVFSLELPVVSSLLFAIVLTSSTVSKFEVLGVQSCFYFFGLISVVTFSTIQFCI